MEFRVETNFTTPFSLTLPDKDGDETESEEHYMMINDESENEFEVRRDEQCLNRNHLVGQKSDSTSKLDLNQKLELVEKIDRDSELVRRDALGLKMVKQSSEFIAIGSPPRSLKTNQPKSIHFSDTPPQVITVEHEDDFQSSETVFEKPVQYCNIPNSRIMVALIFPTSLFVIFVILHVIFKVDSYLQPIS